MTIELHQGPLEPAAPVPAAPPDRKTWREKRWERRRRRIWLEEVLAWVLVPLEVARRRLLRKDLYA